VIRRRVALGTLVGLAIFLSGCSSDLDDAMAKGCEGLRVSAQAYAAGDRPTVEASKDDAEYLGMATELADDGGVDAEQRSDASEAKAAFSALFSAAYYENNRGEQVWQGETPDRRGRVALRTGLDACEGY
jgi:hypothetical protein